MELTRRDALAALGSAGVAGGVVAAGLARDSGDESPASDRTPPTDGDLPLSTLVAVARVVYPSEVEGVETFVRTYASGRATDRPAYRDGVSAAADTLDEYATDWYDGRARDLDTDTLETLLTEMGVRTAEPDADGTDPERVRFFLVNELLYALYTSPTGGKLVGIENPQGHPGGTESYQRGPD